MNPTVLDTRPAAEWCRCLGLGLLIMLGATAARAQSSCSSDGQPAPRALLERFITADCATCWAGPSAAPSKGQLAIDWIVPGTLGDDAPLAAAASRDALDRLVALGQAAPATTFNALHPVKPLTRGAGTPAPSLRVARGLALNAYMGVSIEMTLPRAPVSSSGPLRVWLLLAEEVPAGTEGSPVTRLLVRNALVQSWPAATAKGPRRWFESRPMSLPPGTNPDRLRAVGWVENAQMQGVALAVSHCEYQKE